jgi:hypothetical protein
MEGDRASANFGPYRQVESESGAVNCLKGAPYVPVRHGQIVESLVWWPFLFLIYASVSVVHCRIARDHATIKKIYIPHHNTLG